MGVIIDLLLAVPIGIIYNMIVHESAVVFNDKFNYKDKVQRTLLMIFGGGLIGMVIAMFCLSNSVQNTAIKYGLYLGALLLMSHSVIYNWQAMQNDTRIIVMILTLCILIWYSYTSNTSNSSNIEESKKDKKRKHNSYNNDSYNNDSYNNDQYRENYTYDDFDEIIKLK